MPPKYLWDKFYHHYQAEVILRVTAIHTLHLQLKEAIIASSRGSMAASSRLPPDCMTLLGTKRGPQKEFLFWSTSFQETPLFPQVCKVFVWY